LVNRIGISQSALSQHLAKLREQGLVTFRRESQMLHYRIADPKVLRLLELLHELYCPQLESNRT
jgi:DNA-binding transcriptional ArsR family regulator